MVFSSYSILNNRWKSSVIITLIIMLVGFIALGLLTRESPKTDLKPIEIKLSFVQEPVLSEPVESEPVLSEPVLSEPVLSEPVLSEQVLSEPVLSEPVLSEPVLSEPVLSEPVLSEPVLSEPVLSEPVLSEPVESLFDEISEGGTLPDPTYPKSAIKWKKQGEVEVEIHINRNGSIKDVFILKSSGHPILDNHCIKTIKNKWRFIEQSNSLITRKRFVFKLK